MSSSTASSDGERVVYVVDDERELRISLVMLLRADGINARPFAAADDLLADLPDLKPGCIVTDVMMPDKNGLVFIAELRERGCGWPVVVITGHGDVPTAVRAMKLGATEFLEKPFDHAELFEAIHRSCSGLASVVAQDARIAEARARLGALTPRQRFVLLALERGESNKKIAERLELSTRTVEMHRAAMLRALEVRTTRQALAIAAAAGGADFGDRSKL